MPHVYVHVFFNHLLSANEQLNIRSLGTFALQYLSNSTEASHNCISSSSYPLTWNYNFAMEEKMLFLENTPNLLLANNVYFCMFLKVKHFLIKVDCRSFSWLVASLWMGNNKFMTMLTLLSKVVDNHNVDRCNVALFSGCLVAAAPAPASIIYWILSSKNMASISINVAVN